MNDNVRQQFELLPGLLASHMTLSLSALAAGLAISIPAGIAASQYPKVRETILGIASVVQTIPGLALLALMVPLLGGEIGFKPAFLALMLYSLLPVLRNTVTGLTNLDPAVLEAARGIGMTPRQSLLRVRLPLAAPVILAGVRTSAVWVVGTATLSTPVGEPGLGDYIFTGLQTSNRTAILFGCIFAALLAIVLDQLLRVAEYGLGARKPSLAWGAGVVLVLLFAIGVSPRYLRSRGDDRPLAVLASKPFSEQYILAELMAMRLERAGYRVDIRKNMGSTVLFEALKSGQIDAYVDYTGTIWSTVMNRKDAPGPETVMRDMTGWLLSEHDITVAGALGFENAYCLAMSRSRAQELGIESIADLSRRSDSLVIGSDYEFLGRDEWRKVKDVYTLETLSTRTMDPTLMYPAVRDGQVDTISAYSTDGRIAAFDLIVLNDPKHAFPPYDAVILLSPQAAGKPELVSTLQALTAKIGNDAMRDANRAVDLEGKLPGDVAKALDAEISN